MAFTRMGLEAVLRAREVLARELTIDDVYYPKGTQVVVLQELGIHNPECGCVTHVVMCEIDGKTVALPGDAIGGL